eukprot:3979968-Pleurochrysis_carterae.AAC.1
MQSACSSYMGYGERVRSRGVGGACFACVLSRAAVALAQMEMSSCQPISSIVKFQTNVPIALVNRHPKHYDRPLRASFHKLKKVKVVAVLIQWHFKVDSKLGPAALIINVQRLAHSLE